MFLIYSVVFVTFIDLLYSSMDFDIIIAYKAQLYEPPGQCILSLYITFKDFISVMSYNTRAWINVSIS